MRHTLIVDGFVASKVPSKFYSIVINDQSECGSTAWSSCMVKQVQSKFEAHSIIALIVHNYGSDN